MVQGTGHHYSSSVYYYNGYPKLLLVSLHLQHLGDTALIITVAPTTIIPYYSYPYYDYHDYGYKTKHEGKIRIRTIPIITAPYSETHYSGKIGDTKFETEQYRTPYDSWGETTLKRGDDWAKTQRYSNDKGTVRSIETSKGGTGVSFRGDNHKGGIYKSGNDDLYAGKDGNIYKRDEDGWSKRENGNWNEVSRDNKQDLKTKKEPKGPS